jgi:pyrroloquinoline quinone biosynthesis protein B
VVYATEPVFRGFTDGNVLFRTLQRFPDQVTWRPLKAGREDEVLGTGGRPSGLLVEPVPVPGKPPLHLEERHAPSPEDGIGLRFREARSGQVLAYFSGVAALTPGVRDALADAHAVFFDGTFWSSDELISLGVGEKRAEQMAHLPVGGPGGSLAALGDLRAKRRIYVHLNNTNPLLRDDSPERAAVTAAGWEVAWDGMTMALR